MKKSMMLGMAALTLTVTLAPMQANAAETGNCLQLKNCIEAGNCLETGNGGKVLVYGVNCDTGNIKDTLQNVLNSNCGNLGAIVNGTCADLSGILNGNFGGIFNGNCGNQNGGTTDSPDGGNTDGDNTNGGNDNIGDNTNGGNDNTGDNTDEDNDNAGDSSEDNTEDDIDLTYAQQVVNLVNVERARENLAPLTLDTTVTKAANVRANEIQTSFSHTRPNGSSFSTVLGENGVSYRGSGENIAYGQRSPEEVVAGWMNSPGHRANIMNQNFKNIGVGHATNNNGTQYWVQLFTY